MGRTAASCWALISIVIGYGAFAGCGGRALVDDSESAGARAFAGATAHAGAASFAGAVSGGGALNSAGSGPQSSAGAAGFSWDGCQRNEDCELLPATCCGACEPIMASDLIGVSVTLADRYTATHCPAGIACGQCAGGTTEFDETRKYFRAVCPRGKCEVFDVRGTPFTACATTAACTLREGVDCCPQCDGQGWVPVNSSIDFCNAPTACPPCATTPPVGLATTCQAGLCQFGPSER